MNLNNNLLSKKNTNYEIFNLYNQKQSTDNPYWNERNVFSISLVS